MAQSKETFTRLSSLEGEELKAHYRKFVEQVEQRVFKSIKRPHEFFHEELHVSMSTLNIDEVEEFNRICREYEMRYDLVVHYGNPSPTYPQARMFCHKQVPKQITITVKK